MRPLFFLTSLIIITAILITPASASEQMGIPPSHILYPAKIFIEDIQETLTFNEEELVKLKTKHLDNRIAELQYEMSRKNTKNMNKLIERIQTKRIEVEGMYEDTDNPMPEVYKERSQKSVEIISNLLDSPTMPEQSRVGLQNALNRTGMSREIKANMAQGTYQVSPTAVGVMPFQRAMLYEPVEGKWYSIILTADGITISDQTLMNPEFYIYPSTKQVNEIMNMAAKINRDGLTIKNKLKLASMWYKINKKEVS